VKVGDRVRIVSNGLDADDSYLERHRAHENREGEVTRIDIRDDTAYVQLCEDAGWWFRMSGLNVVVSSQKLDDAQYCSCSGPEKTVVILFQPVRVCGTCKKEKR